MIYETDFQKQIEDAFLAYGASIAQERAIPDVRDMLKIGLRQGLYAQYSNKLTHKDKYQKAQKSVAAAMSQSYVHGDAAMYDALIRAARPWSLRYPIEDVQGNYGNPSSPDSHAAARYVEMRAGEIAEVYFAGLKKNAIGDEWYPNYDDTEQIPAVFPSIGFWGVVNGSAGIAVSMATSVPQFNLKEVNSALIKIIKDPTVNFDEIYCPPDFATGGTIINGAAVKESLKNGNGESIRLQANLTYHPEKHMIQATELPYGVFTNTIIKQLAEIVEENENYGIDKVVDHTKKIADIRIYLSKGASPKKMIAKLYKDTSLENWYSINMIMLDMGRYPKLFSWRSACDAYIAHIRACKTREIQFDLDKALARKNILDGLIKAYSIIDDVVALIRASASPAEASTELQTKLGFNAEQAKAILAMKLSSLTKLDIVKLNEELKKIEENISWYTYLLNESTALDGELIKALQQVMEKFGDERRTKILNIVSTEEETVEPIEEEELAIMLFDNNMIRLIKNEDLQGGKKGRKGVSIKPPKGANLINTIYSTNLGTLAAFTDSGKMYSFSLADLEYNKDYSVYEIISISATEKVMLLIDTTSFNSYHYLITVSKNGYVKKTAISEYTSRAKKGVAAVKLDSGDTLVGVYLTMDDSDRLMIAGKNGYYNLYEVGTINATGRVSRGVRAIKLASDEEVCGATLIRNSLEYKGILSIAANGAGKITALDQFSNTTRGTKGNQIMALKDNNLAAIYAVSDTQEKLYVTANNKAVIVEVSAIPIQGRATSGVKIISTTGLISGVM